MSGLVCKCLFLITSCFGVSGRLHFVIVGILYVSSHIFQNRVSDEILSSHYENTPIQIY